MTPNSPTITFPASAPRRCAHFIQQARVAAENLEKRRRLTRLLFLAVSCLTPLLCASNAVAASAGQNWPQWRGPLATGGAPSANPPVTWSETNNLKWKVKIPGEGSATPVIWDNLIFIETAVPTGRRVGTPAAQPASAPAPADPPQNPPPRGGGRGMGSKPTELYQFVVLCLDRQTGKVLWQQTAREEVPHEGVMQNEGNFASCSPVTDGEHVFAYFGSRGLYCYDLDGKLQWTNDLGRMQIRMTFGEGGSPALHGDTLIVNWDNEAGSFITAIDKRNGKQLWKVPREEKTAWATPLIVEVAGKPQVVTTATGKIRSYDLATGELVWQCAGMTQNAIPTPVLGDGIIYCISGFQGSSLLAIRLGRTGDLTGTDAIAWSYKRNTPYVPSPLLYDGRIYFFKLNDAILTCCDAKTGNVLIDAERLEALQGVYASPIGAGGRVYLVGRNGAAVVLKPADKLEVLATNKLDDRFDASPVAVGRELFLRGKASLYCIAEK